MFNDAEYERHVSIAIDTAAANFVTMLETANLTIHHSRLVSKSAYNKTVHNSRSRDTRTAALILLNATFATQDVVLKDALEEALKGSAGLP